MMIVKKIHNKVKKVNANQNNSCFYDFVVILKVFFIGVNTPHTLHSIISISIVFDIFAFSWNP
jgi:hypothetical protein